MLHFRVDTFSEGWQNPVKNVKLLHFRKHPFSEEMHYTSDRVAFPVCVSIPLKNKDYKQICPSRKQTYIILTPLNPTFIWQNWGLQGYTLFSLFLLKT